ncbi:alpha/beta hydrolase [Streptomyces sp. P1-3]|uniref:alpha/beta hydrolase n=1 Tax=Streptomyces sp. P1-3 TaxID=3421658 RepID=UPI003D35BE87
MDFKTLKALNPAEFEGAADGYQSVSNMAQHAKEALEYQITANMRKKLEGKVREAALVQLSELSKNFHYTQVQCGVISTALNGLAHDLREAKAKLNRAVQDAGDEGFTVNADGSVSYPAADDKDGKKQPGGSVTGYTVDKSESKTALDDVTKQDPAKSLADQAANIDPNPNAARAQPIAHRIAQAVREATEADDLWAPQLRRLKADDDMTVSDADWIDTKRDTEGVRKAAKDYLDDIKIPSKDSDPASNAKWWKGLSPDERDALIALQPASVGKLDGLPAEARNEANRTVLADTHAEVSQKLHELDQKEPTKYEQKWDKIRQVPIQGEQQLTIAWESWNKKRSEILDQLKSLESLQSRVEQPGEDLPKPYLLGFSADGQGRAIVAHGNPDTADHTAVYVPGTFSKLSGAGGDIDRMGDLWRRSQGEVPGQSVSTITWIGYDAPQDLAIEATDDSYARNAAPKLNRFLDGLQAAQGGPEASHTTVIGHSYGSTVVGAASIDGKLAADDFVAAGSPGVLVGHADDLDVGKDHVWSLAGTWDPVPAGGKLAGLGGDSDISPWVEWLPFGYAWGQNVPSDEDFGAHRMEAGAITHTKYFEEDTVSLKNQAFVVTGKYDRVDYE